MATIKLKNGSGAPLASDLVQGEPALDLTNKRLYTEDTLGAVIEVGVNPTELNVTNNITVGGTVDGRDVATDGTKLDGIESGATADQTAAEIRTLVDSATDSNVFTDADHTKLDGIEALADVTDTANVTAAGALMDSELTSEASVKALNQGVATTDSPTFAGVTVNGNVEFDGLSGTGSVTVTDILDQDDMSSNSATALATQQSIKAYVDSQVATADTLAEVLGNGNTTGGTDIAVGTGDDITFADSSKAIFGADSDLQIYHDSNNSFVKDAGTGDLYVAADNLRLTNSSATEFYARGISNGAFSVYYDGAEKLATTATGIDVTGTVTADGLDVSTETGSATPTATELKISSSTNASDWSTTDNWGVLGFYSADGSGGGAGNRAEIAINMETATGAFGSLDFTLANPGNTYAQSSWLKLENSASSASRKVSVYADNGLDVKGGDVSFYEDTGVDAKFFWDASAESLGIGTSSPTTTLDVTGTVTADGLTVDGTATISEGSSGATAPSDSNTLIVENNGNAGAVILTPDGSSGQLRFGDVTDGSSAFVQYNSTDNLMTVGTSRASGELRFTTGNVGERVRIDSSGNLLVGKTSTGTGTVGAELRANGFNAFVRDGGEVVNFNRLTSDGTIAEFRKDSSTVGSIGTNLSRIHMSAGDAGLFLDGGGTPAIWPWKSTATTSGDADAEVDLGDSSNRFKDGHFSGNINANTFTAVDGVYIGGVGFANKLDDYEEGTWTPAYAPSSGSFATITYDASTAGSYTKVGNVCTVWGLIRTENVDVTGASGALLLTGLPFTASGFNGVMIPSLITNFAANDAPHSGYVQTGGTTINLRKRSASDGSTAGSAASDLNAGVNADHNYMIFAMTYRTA